jgi:hypothetical protein
MDSGRTEAWRRLHEENPCLWKVECTEAGYHSTSFYCDAELPGDIRDLTRREPDREDSGPRVTRTARGAFEDEPNAVPSAVAFRPVTEVERAEAIAKFLTTVTSAA